MKCEDIEYMSKECIGFQLRHQFESCLVGKKGTEKQLHKIAKYHTESNVIVEMRRRNSQKPDSFRELIHNFAPGRHYCEIFARDENRYKGWVSIGNELSVPDFGEAIKARVHK